MKFSGKIIIWDYFIFSYKMMMKTKNEWDIYSHSLAKYPLKLFKQRENEWDGHSHSPFPCTKHVLNIIKIINYYLSWSGLLIKVKCKLYSKLKKNKKIKKTEKNPQSKINPRIKNDTSNPLNKPKHWVGLELVSSNSTKIHAFSTTGKKNERKKNRH